MANEEHLSTLKDGIGAWTHWWHEHPDVQADLSGADLRGLDLTGATFCNVNFFGANLNSVLMHNSVFECANLENANLKNADLSRSFLVEAKLSFARLDEADLRYADLSRANLTDTTLVNSDLCGSVLLDTIFARSNIANANFEKAQLSATVFANVDLTEARGLCKCTHFGPSSIDHQTLLRSGSLPIGFLRGCGLPDTLIYYLPSLLNDAIQFYSCFISYSSKDQDFADRLHADLQNKGIRCWFAPHDLLIGAKTWDAIDEAIRLRDKLLLILSENSIASDWVEDEVSKAFAEERLRDQLVLFPLRIDGSVCETGEPWAAKLRDQRNIGDFTRWKDHDAYQKAFDRVVRDLRAEGGAKA